MPDGRFGPYPYGQQNAWSGMIPGGGTTNATQNNQGSTNLDPWAGILWNNNSNNNPSYYYNTSSSNAGAGGNRSQNWVPYPTQTQGYNYNIPLPDMMDFGAWMSAHPGVNPSMAYDQYMRDMQGIYQSWMGGFQMQMPNMTDFWNNFRGMFGNMYGGGMQYPQFGAPPAFDAYNIPNAPGITGAPTPGAGTNAQWNWQDFNTGQYQPGQQWQQQMIDPASLQNVQAYIDAYQPYADELRERGFNEAAQKFGSTGMLMSTPYSTALGEVERNVESDYNRLAQEARMGAYENWAGRDLAAQQANAANNLAAWGQYGQWGHEGQMSDLERAFQANMAKNQLGLQDVMSQRDVGADLYGQESQNWALRNQLAAQNWATQAGLGVDQNMLQNQLASQQWAQQGDWNLANAQLQGELGLGYNQLNAGMMQNMLPLFLQMAMSGFNPFGGGGGSNQGSISYGGAWQPNGPFGGASNFPVNIPFGGNSGMMEP